MEKSLKPGTTLSVNPKKSIQKLKALASSNLINTINKVLPDGDLHLVGGAVRDSFFDLTELDIDIATILTPELCQKRFHENGFKVIPTGIQHGTITVVIDEQNIEITTFRKPGSRNVSAFSSTIEEDLSGRDFTINALAFSISKLTLIDPFNGLQDIIDHRLKCVGDPDSRFREDPLRILRMIRFGPAQNRAVDKDTLAAAKHTKELLKSVSQERIRTELCHILTSPDPTAAFIMMKDCNLLEIILPEILPSIGFEQNEFHVHDVFEHTLWVLDRCPQENLKLRLSALFHDLGKPHTLSIGEDGRRHFYDHETISTTLCNQAMDRLKFSQKMTADVADIVRLHMRPIDCGPAGVRRLMRDLGENFAEWRIFKAADSPPVLGEEDFETRAARFDQLVADENERLKNTKLRKLAITGHDIMNLGIQEGRVVGQILKELEELVIENPSDNNREFLINKARKRIC